MLKTQLYLKTKGLDSLKNRYGIKTTEHDDGRIVLNYDMIESPKNAGIVRECRGLCLDRADYSLVSRSFYRFFNFGESRAEDNKFDWNNCSALSKEDGTLLIVYNYKGKWCVQTRGSFGDIPYYPGGPTPLELYMQARLSGFDGLNPKLSYSFELCSLHNKIVREYKTPTIYLLSVFDGEREYSYDEVIKEFKVINFAMIGEQYIQLPEEYVCSNINEVRDLIEKRSRNDPTFEGLVLRDSANNRLKVKSPKYLSLHAIKGEGNNLFMPKYLLPFILNNDLDELLCYYSEVKDRASELKTILDGEYARLKSTWDKIRHLKVRKDFALAIPNDIKLKSILFTAYLKGKELDEVWKDSYNLILRGLFNG